MLPADASPDTPGLYAGGAALLTVGGGMTLPPVDIWEEVRPKEGLLANGGLGGVRDVDADGGLTLEEATRFFIKIAVDPNRLMICILSICSPASPSFA